MRKLLCLLLISVFVIVGCSEKNDDTTEGVCEPQVTDSTEPTNESNDTESKESEYLDDYALVLNKYRTAVSEQWDMMQLRAESLNYMFSSNYVFYNYSGDSRTDLVGYSLIDVNSDGVDELLIGRLGSEHEDSRMIYDMWTLVDGVPKIVFNRTERGYYYLCEDGTVYSYGSNSASQSVYYAHKLYKGELHLIYGIVCDGDIDPENPWFETFIEGLDPITYTPLSEESAKEKLDEYEQQYRNIDYQALSGYVPLEESTRYGKAGTIKVIERDGVKYGVVYYSGGSVSYSIPACATDIKATDTSLTYSVNEECVEVSYVLEVADAISSAPEAELKVKSITDTFGDDVRWYDRVSNNGVQYWLWGATDSNIPIYVNEGYFYFTDVGVHKKTELIRWDYWMHYNALQTRIEKNEFKEKYESIANCFDGELQDLLLDSINLGSTIY